MPFLGLVAILAINGAIIARLKGYQSFIAAIGADHGIHRAGFSFKGAVATIGACIAATHALFSLRTAGRTTTGGVCESTTGKEFLLTSRKGELLITIAAIQCLIRQRRCHFLDSRQATRSYIVQQSRGGQAKKIIRTISVLIKNNIESATVLVFDV